jgi:hypothetical protein
MTKGVFTKRSQIEKNRSKPCCGRDLQRAGGFKNVGMAPTSAGQMAGSARTYPGWRGGSAFRLDVCRDRSSDPLDAGHRVLPVESAARRVSPRLWRGRESGS